MYEVESLLIKTDVTYVKIIHNVVVAAIGGHLHIFDRTNRTLRKTVKVFEGQKIYGVDFNSQLTECLIYGANKIKLFFCNSEFDTFKEKAYETCKDWILIAKWLDADRCIATVLMHNCVSLWTQNIRLIKNVYCSEKCLLYSAFIIGDTWENLIILSGTVFSEVLVWKPHEVDSSIYHLEGHKGVIFSIDCDPKKGLICSTSDDRSAKLWSTLPNQAITENQYSKLQISIKCSLYGHTARVFRCRILDEYIITAGEDSLINIWNIHGVLLKKFDAHQGAPVWAIDYDEQNGMVASGGGDCGVNLFKVKQNSTKRNVQIPGDEVCKKLAIVNDNDLAIITEHGVVFHYSSTKSSWNQIARHDALQSYALLEVSNCKQFLALAGYYGSIILYENVNSTLKIICTFETEDKSRIFSIHWLSSNTFLTCGIEGLLNLWQLKELEIICVSQLKLPMIRERWTTSAVILNEKNIAVGDRNGNIYLYSLSKMDPLQVIKKAHNHLGVTSLHFEKNILTTLGRNSLVKKFYFDEASETLTLFSSDKVPLTWLVALYIDNNTEFLLSFMGNEFILWDYKKRRIVQQFDCGGGHRSWDFHFNRTNFNFAYIKDKLINMVQIDLTSILPLTLVEGYHVSEINSLVFLPLKYTDSGILISGGEDTTLRINKVVRDTNLINFTSLNTLKVHLSSIRVVKAFKVYEDLVVQKYLLFTGGGRGHIILWKLEITSIDSGDLSVECCECDSVYEQDSNISEVRVMDLCILVCNSYTILVSACSNGSLNLYQVVEQINCYKLHLQGTVVYKLKCILKVSHIHIFNRNILITMATDGKISFWDFTLIVENINTPRKNIHLSPFACFETHQSGINSFTYNKISETQYVFLTGGDDNAIIISLFSFSFISGEVKVELLYKYCDISSHCAQVTGAFIIDSYFITTSIDQKLNVFKYKIDNDVVTCNYLKKYNSCIPDIQGMTCYNKYGSIFVILFGKGVEVCEIKELLIYN